MQLACWETRVHFKTKKRLDRLILTLMHVTCATGFHTIHGALICFPIKKRCQMFLLQLRVGTRYMHDGLRNPCLIFFIYMSIWVVSVAKVCSPDT